MLDDSITDVPDGESEEKQASSSPTYPVDRVPSPTPNVETTAGANTLSFDLFGHDTAWDALGFGSKSQNPNWFRYSETDALLRDLVTTEGPVLRPGSQNIYQNAYIDPDRALIAALVEEAPAKIREEVNERAADAMVKLLIGELTGPVGWAVTNVVQTAVEKGLESAEDKAAEIVRAQFQAAGPGPVPSPSPGLPASEPNEENHWLFVP